MMNQLNYGEKLFAERKKGNQGQWKKNMFIDFRSREVGEREKDIDVREKYQHWPIASHTRPDRESNLQPENVSWLGTKPLPFGVQGQHYSQTESPSQDYLQLHVQ